MLWLACSAATYLVLSARPGDRTPMLLLSAFTGFFGALFLLNLWGLVSPWGDLAAARRGERGEPFRDGRREAVSGAIYPVGEPLTSPFEARPCVAYQYEIGTAITVDQQRGRSGGARDYTGVALTPCEIRTERGTVRVLGWAMLDAFEPRTPGRDEARERAARLVATASFENLGLGQALSAVRGLLTDDDGSIRKDWRISGDGTLSPEARLEERTVDVGQTVTMIGPFSEAKGALVPGNGEVIGEFGPGDLGGLRRRLFRKSLFATLFLLAANVFLGVMTWLALGD